MCGVLCRRNAIPRPVWMAIGQAINIIANVLFAFERGGFLTPASAIMGFCFGVQVSVMIPTASELFGLKHFGVIYNFINMSIPLSSLLFSALLAGHLYDSEAGPGNHVCYGMQCFQLFFMIEKQDQVIYAMGCSVFSSHSSHWDVFVWWEFLLACF